MTRLQFNSISFRLIDNVQKERYIDLYITAEFRGSYLFLRGIKDSGLWSKRNGL